MNILEFFKQVADAVINRPLTIIPAVLVFAVSVYIFLWALRTATAHGFWKTITIAFSALIAAVTLLTLVIVFARYVTYWAVPQGQDLFGDAFGVLTQDQASASAQSANNTNVTKGDDPITALEKVLGLDKLLGSLPSTKPQTAPQPQPTPPPQPQPQPQPTPPGDSSLLPGEQPAISQQIGGNGSAVLGGACSTVYATSGDLICSKDCGMTWRSLSYPGVCYNK